MYAKVYQYKFPGISEAKVAAAFCSDYLGQKIDEHNFHGLSVLISQEGDLTILIKFDDVTKLKSFDKVADQFVEDLKNSFVFKENKYAGIYVYNYEKEATINEIKLTGPAKVSIKIIFVFLLQKILFSLERT
tara:strand:- start:375 stop:770 length:396 start_codon:yes stop_codon:yes gene_type:complete